MSLTHNISRVDIHYKMNQYLIRIQARIRMLQFIYRKTKHFSLNTAVLNNIFIQGHYYYYYLCAFVAFNQNNYLSHTVCFVIVFTGIKAGQHVTHMRQQQQQ